MIFALQPKLLHHLDRIKEWLDRERTYPILVEIAPTNYCNALCPWCFFKDRKKKSAIDKEIMIKTINEMVELGVKAINWTGGGEPTLHPNFKGFVYYASKCHLKQGLFTNGYQTIPNQDKFEWIRISLTDGGFSKIKKPKVPFGICVNHIESYSNKDLKKFCLEAKKFGAKYFQIRPALVGSYKEQPLITAPIFLTKYRSKDFEVYITDYKYKEAVRPKEYKYCYGYHLCPSIDWNGKVSACLYLSYDSDFIFGDLNKTSFSDIWSSIPKKVKVIEECQNCCKNHEINKILYSAKNVESVDFL